MKKIIFPVIISMLFLSCTREEWNEDRRVQFVLFNDINFNTSDDDVSLINCSIQYNIIGETDTVHIQNASNFNSYENYSWTGPFRYRHYSDFYTLKNYDYLEFKLTINSTSLPHDSKHILTARSELKLPNNYRLQTDTLTSFNNSDTIIYFTWSPPNFN